jgi:hypothetical protein
MDTNKQTPGPQGERDTDGKYTCGLERMCVCGHKLGSHAAAGPLKSRVCMAADCEADVESCDCAGFRRAKVRVSK